jgi:serine/threonine protein kinase
MVLSAGAHSGPCEILAPLGAGGIGEVYRARDTKLGPEVAIKVLPAEVAQDSERLARFQRAATLLAALNHPHIAAIYGLEADGGNPFLVLELVEGEDLAQRLERGPIPVGEALEIARQIAEALEEAHEKGIIHRDLKPANVKVTPGGAVPPSLTRGHRPAPFWAPPPTCPPSRREASPSTSAPTSGPLASSCSSC